MDPISLIRKAISSIRKLSGIIREVKVNKKQCEQLGKRIDIICETLQELQNATTINGNIQNTLDEFCKLIDECTNFITKFVDVPRFKRVCDRRTYTAEFERYDKELSMYATLLQLALSIAQILDRSQDQVDRMQDRAAIENKFNEIVGKLSENQDGLNEKLLQLTERINTMTENLFALSNQIVILAETRNELLKYLSDPVHFADLHSSKLKQNLKVHEQLVTQVIETNRKRPGILRKSFRRFKRIFKS